MVTLEIDNRARALLLILTTPQLHHKALPARIELLQPCNFRILRPRTHMIKTNDRKGDIVLRASVDSFRGFKPTDYIISYVLR